MRINLYRMLQNTDSELELQKEKGFNYVAEKEKITSPYEIAKMMTELFHMDIQAEEYMYMLAYNKGKIAGIFEISHGCMDQSFANPREIFRKALLCNAANIILCHNHPSGDLSPSKADVTTTEKIKEAGKIIGMELLDHIIIGRNYEYLSFHEEKLLKN